MLIFLLRRLSCSRRRFDSLLSSLFFLWCQPFQYQFSLSLSLFNHPFNPSCLTSFWRDGGTDHHRKILLVIWSMVVSSFFLGVRVLDSQDLNTSFLAKWIFHFLNKRDDLWSHVSQVIAQFPFAVSMLSFLDHESGYSSSLPFCFLYCF